MKKRIWGVFLALCMVLSLLPLSATAAEISHPCGGLLSQPQLETSLVHAAPDAAKRPALRAQSNAGSDVCTTIEEAAAVLRAGMKQRETSITFTYVDDEDLTEDLLHAIFAASLAHTGVPTEGDYLNWQIGNSYSGASISYDGVYYTSTITYTFESFHDTYAQEQEVDAAAAEIVSSLSGGSDYEIIRGIYDYLGETVSYDYDAAQIPDDQIVDYTPWSAYGALVKHQAVCQGYALAFYRLALELGVDARIVTGIGNGGAHAWNVAQLDGLYYYLDSTWGGEKYFLRGTEDFDKHTPEDSSLVFLEGMNLSPTAYVPPVDGGKCGENLTWAFYPDGTLKIDGTGAMYDYNDNGYAYKDYDCAPWASYFPDYNLQNPQEPYIQNIQIGKDVESIGAGAFISAHGWQQNPYNLVLDVTFEQPSACREIKDRAFAYTQVKNLEFPERLETLGFDAFYGSALESLDLPESVASIGSSAFSWCENLSNVTIRGPVETIQSCTFCNVKHIENFYMPGTVRAIGNDAFYGVTLDHLYFGNTSSIWNTVQIESHNDALYSAEKHFLKLLAITAQPENFVGAVGGTAVFSVTAEGDDLAYQWQYSDDNGGSWVNSNSTAETATCKITAARDGRLYRCVVSDGAASVTSDPAKLIVKPAITTQPQDYTGTVGNTASFTVKATGAKLTYQWQYSDNNGGTWTDSSANTSAVATCKLTAARNGRLYRCIVTAGNGMTVTSEVAKITVKPAITAQPQDFTGTVGETAAFTVKASGANLTYQWQYKDPGGAWTTSKSTTNTATCKITAARDGRQYRCVVTGNGVTVTSDVAKITVKPAITAQPQDYTGPVGGVSTFTVKATGAGLTYQWQYSDNSGGKWTDSVTNTSATATCKITAARDGRLYRCIVTDANGNSLTTNTAALIVR